MNFGDFTGMGDTADPERLLGGPLGALVGGCCGEVGGGGFSNLDTTGVVSGRLLDDE